MSSTAIVMGTLGERGELATEHGRTTFAVLMAQDMWVVPAIALVPILAHTTNQGAAWSVEQVGVSMTLGAFLLPPSAMSRRLRTSVTRATWSPAARSRRSRS